MKHSTNTPTKAQKERFRKLQEFGCIACFKELDWSAPDIHHIVEGGRRLGHDFTLPLCPWHHRGIQWDEWTARGMEEVLGPSLAHSKRKFVEWYGTERELLELVNERLEMMP